MKYKVLYTHQKTKKAKIWQDGFLTRINATKLTLTSDTGKYLESVFTKVIDIGDEIESDMHLISIEETVPDITPDVNKSGRGTSGSITPASRVPPPPGRLTNNPARKKFIPPVRRVNTAIVNNSVNSTINIAERSILKGYTKRTTNICTEDVSMSRTTPKPRPMFTTCSQFRTTDTTEKKSYNSVAVNNITNDNTDSAVTDSTVTFKCDVVGEAGDHWVKPLGTSSSEASHAPRLKFSTLSDSDEKVTHRRTLKDLFNIMDSKISSSGEGADSDSRQIGTKSNQNEESKEYGNFDLSLDPDSFNDNMDVDTTAITTKAFDSITSPISERDPLPSHKITPPASTFRDLPQSHCPAAPSQFETVDYSDMFGEEVNFEVQHFPEVNLDGYHDNQEQPSETPCFTTRSLTGHAPGLINENLEMKMVHGHDRETENNDLLGYLEDPQNTSHPPNKRARLSTKPSFKAKFKTPFSNDQPPRLHSNSYQFTFSRDKKWEKRHETIPLSFADSAAYGDCILRVVYESINVQLSKICYRYHNIKFARDEGLKLSPQLYFEKYRKQGLSLYKGCSVSRITPKKYKIVLPYHEKSSAYNQDDIWILSPDSPSPCIAKSISYGPNSDGVILMEIISSNPPSLTTTTLIHGISAMCHLDVIGSIESIPRLPLIPALLRKSLPLENCRVSFAESNDVIGDVISSMSSKFSLNEKQEESIMSFVSALKDGLPVHLVHGVFGAGKSHLIALLIIILTRILSPTERVLITSTTNVAVDNILIKLLQMGFDGFIRIGSSRKVNKLISPYLKSESTSHPVSPGSPDVQVIGSTCASAAGGMLRSPASPCSVVILDEASQITEPASLIPLLSVRAKAILLVGDPLQLPPTVETPHVHGSSAKGLEQTLFDRLRSLGYPLTMLQTQYRCHPQISRLSNLLFYNSSLRDGIVGGCSVENLSPVSFVSCNGTEKMFGDSFSNAMEVDLVKEILSKFQSLKIDESSIGIITLYRGQEFLLKKSIKASRKLKISTVDAFQGAEKDVIILSCVRSCRIGFADCPRRVNVALTRAKNHLIILGNISILSVNNLWGKIIELCATSKAVFTRPEIIDLLSQ